MKKSMRSMVAALCLAAVGASAFAFTGCSDKDETGKVMNIALNPEVEFVLDGKDKVVTVNALNEEGNLVISAEVFANVEGMEAEEAAKLFVQVCEETGFLIQGNVGTDENQLKISFSGDTKEAEKLFKEVKSEVNDYLKTLEKTVNVTVSQAAAITEEALEALVAECAPYLQEAEIKAMEYAELLKEIETSRKETAQYYSQELKNAYYDAKAYAFQKAELSVWKEQVGVIEQAALSVAEGLYDGAMKALNTAREALLDENGVYQKALASFREKKVEFLNYKNYVNSLPEEEVTQAQLDRLTNIETVLNGLEETMSGAVAGIDALKTSVTNSYQTIVGKIQEYSVKVSEHLDEVSEKQKAALTALTTQFESDYATVKNNAKTAWGEMRTQLEAGYTPEAE